MGNKRGNPAWVKGKSANPKGRPRGQNSYEVLCNNPGLFFIRHLRWERFCFEYFLVACNGAKAARRVGYSPKSARFIAYRLLKKPIIRATLMRINELTCNPVDRPRYSNPAIRWRNGGLW
jgi:hypothetical protein